MPISPKGFDFAVYSAGFRKEQRNDVALVLSHSPCVWAAMFTQNAFAAAPVLVAREQLATRPLVRAVLINSGQANACTGSVGIANCRATQAMVAQAAHIEAADVLPASTGVIGDQMHMDKWQKAAPALVGLLGKASLEDFARAIMTTDAFPKMAAREVALQGGTVRVAGVAKGAGMICPNMATMLATVLCDAEVKPDDWKAIFAKAVGHSLNRVSVDGDTSTNDTAYGLANGASQVAAASSGDLKKLEQALTEVLDELAYMLVKDGEGASKVAHIRVEGGASMADAELVARTVGHSPLVKTALYGQDANWGRIIMAIGRSGAEFNPEDVRVSIAGIEVFAFGQPAGEGVDGPLTQALKERDIHIDITLGKGQGEYLLLASDLGHEYIDCNASYRS